MSPDFIQHVLVEGAYTLAAHPAVLEQMAVHPEMRPICDPQQGGRPQQGAGLGGGQGVQGGWNNVASVVPPATLSVEVPRLARAMASHHPMLRLTHPEGVQPPSQRLQLCIKHADACVNTAMVSGIWLMASGSCGLGLTHTCHGTPPPAEGTYDQYPPSGPANSHVIVSKIH